MKILFAIKTLNTSKGGAERVLADLTSDLSEKSHNISILSFDQPKGKAFYPLNKKVHRVSLGIGDVTRRANFREFITRALVIRKTAKRLKPDCVIAFMHSTFIPTSFALIGTGVPVVASEHIVPTHYKDRWWEFILLALSLLFVKKVTVLSPSIITRYPRLLQSKMLAIPNPVHAAKTPINKNKTHKIILNVGRLTPQKDQATLIEAFAKIEKDYPDWKLRIIGEGELKQTLEKQICDLHVQERIDMPGTTAQINKEYQGADILALSSIYESFGLVTAEAMAHGVPAIGFADCPGTNELIIDQENGLLVAGHGNRADSLAQALKTLIDDSVLREKLGRNAPDTVKKFHPDNITQKWESLLIDITGNVS